MDGVFDSKTVIDGLKAVQSQIAAAGSILIVGGGPVGVELAGTLLICVVFFFGMLTRCILFFRRDQGTHTYEKGYFGSLA